MATKANLAQKALSKIGVTGFDYEVDPEEIKDAIVELEYMMADWDARGIKCGYQFAADPETVEASQESGLPDIAFRAVTTNLAVAIAPMYGKEASQSVFAAASASLGSLLNAIQFVPATQYGSRMPLGSGNNRWGRNFQRYYRPAQTLDADNAGPIETNGDGVLQP